MMDQQTIAQEVRKAADLFTDNTWDKNDLVARMIQLIGEASGEAPLMDRLKSFLRQLIEMRRLQRRYFEKDKSVLSKCKGAESEVDKLTNAFLKVLNITDVEKFLQEGKPLNLFK